MKPLHFPLAVVLIISLSSCLVQKRYLHNAAPAFIPMLKDKGEGYISGSYHNNEEEENITQGNGFNVQGGYAFSKNWAIAGGYNHIGHKSEYTGTAADPFEASYVTYKRNEITLALDYFILNTKQKVGFNFLAGFTSGKLKIDDEGQYLSAPYRKHFYSDGITVFLQPGMNLYPSKIFSIGFAPRLCYVSYSKNNTNYTGDQMQKLGLGHIVPFVSTELGMKFSFGPEKIPLTFDLQLNYILNAPNDIYVRNTDQAIGITYKFTGSHKK